MIIISHRGNIGGPSNLENSPGHIKIAIAKGFDVEVDVWLHSGVLWFGHDKPDYIVPSGFLKAHQAKLWIHCKNVDAADYLSRVTDYSPNYFSHESDNFVITKSGNLWTQPGHKLMPNSVCVLPELSGQIPENCHAVCTDYPYSYTAG